MLVFTHLARFLYKYWVNDALIEIKGPHRSYDNCLETEN